MGKRITSFFDEIYRVNSKYCVIFVSKEYKNHEYTNFERKSALARAVKEKGNEYILPIKIDNTDLPEISPTTGYLDIKKYSIEKIAEILIRKIGKENE